MVNPQPLDNNTLGRPERSPSRPHHELPPSRPPAVTGEDERAAEWAEPARLAWEAFREAYDRYQDEHPGWRAFWTDHHAYSLDAALRAGFAALAASPAVTEGERATCGRALGAGGLCNEPDGHDGPHRPKSRLVPASPAVTAAEDETVDSSLFPCPWCREVEPPHAHGCQTVTVGDEPDAAIEWGVLSEPWHQLAAALDVPAAPAVTAVPAEEAREALQLEALSHGYLMDDISADAALAARLPDQSGRADEKEGNDGKHWSPSPPPSER